MQPANLTWKQINTWRLGQQGLAPQLPAERLQEAAHRTGGIQAQVMSAAELALGARSAEVTPSKVQTALWMDRTLVKTWAMRGTLHLLTADQLALSAAVNEYTGLRGDWPRAFRQEGVPEKEYYAYLETAPELLSDQGMTKQELAEALSQQAGLKRLGELLLTYHWGGPLKPLAWAGDLAFGPNNGRNVTFVNPRKWLKNWPAWEPEAAIQEAARRYLRHYGPGTADSFAFWWGMNKTPARKAFRLIEDELTPVDVDGWPALALKSELDALQAAKPSGAVVMLPLFDAYILGLGRHAELEPHLANEHHIKVFRPQGWVTATVVADGDIVGVWESKAAKAHMDVVVTLWSKPSKKLLAGIKAEVKRLEGFWGRDVKLEI